MAGGEKPTLTEDRVRAIVREEIAAALAPVAAHAAHTVELLEHVIRDDALTVRTHHDEPLRIGTKAVRS